jgi:hypothetical protein
MRFEVASALAMGTAVPLLATCLEYCRQGFTLSFAAIRGDLQDYLSSALLLIAGLASVRLRPFAPALAVLAWAYFTSMMVDSTWAQIDDTLRGEMEPHNTLIITFKLGIVGVALTSLILSFRHVSQAVRGNSK